MAFQEDLLVKLKLSLDAEGFKTSWTNPLSEWLRNTTLPIPYEKHELFIADPPIPRMAPFDCAYCRITPHEKTISFELYLCFVREPAKAVTGEDYNAIRDTYATKWYPQIAWYFGDFATRFGLTAWTDYDESIDYCLWKNIDIEQWGEIIEMMLELKALAEK